MQLCRYFCLNATDKTFSLYLKQKQNTAFLDILSALDVKHVDYLVLDVEGFEPAILRSFTWATVSVDLIQLEVVQGTYYNTPNVKFFKEFLESRGFVEQNSLCIDMIFRRQNSSIPDFSQGYKFGSNPSTRGMHHCPKWYG